MLSVLRYLNYKPWFAIAEFIDNSVQSYMANRDALIALHGPQYKLRVKVEIDTAEPSRIVITDNAAGISEADFPRAFRAAQIPTDRSGLSEFGMGMKSAACWFAQRWNVRTKAIGESVERSISFDVGHIVNNRIESLAVVTREERSPTSYTVVTLEGLHHLPQGRTIGKIRDHLASIYRVFLRDGRLELLVNSEKPLSFEEVPVLNAAPYSSSGAAEVGAAKVEWKKQINFDFGMGQRVTGFAALRDVGSTLYAGFALFRRDRLIEGSLDETYRPSKIFKQTNSYTYQRLFGELHVEGFEVSHTKDGFRWEEFEDEFLELLKEHLQSEPLDLLKQAEDYRSRPTRGALQPALKRASEAVVRDVTEGAPVALVEEDIAVSPSPPVNLEPVAVPELVATTQIASLEVDNLRWEITVRTTVDPAVSDWLRIGEQLRQSSPDGIETRHLTIEVSMAHPFVQQFIGASNENTELFIRMAIGIALALLKAQMANGYSLNISLFYLNRLLRDTLTRSAA